MTRKRKGVSSEITQAAQTLSRIGAAQGGRARWAHSTAEDRTNHFRRLAQQRWSQVRAKNASESKADNPSPQDLEHDQAS
jgi:hypothetical protein